MEDDGFIEDDFIEDAPKAKRPKKTPEELAMLQEDADATLNQSLGDRMLAGGMGLAESVSGGGAGDLQRIIAGQKLTPRAMLANLAGAATLPFAGATAHKYINPEEPDAAFGGDSYDRDIERVSGLSPGDYGVGHAAGDAWNAATGLAAGAGGGAVKGAGEAVKAVPGKATDAMGALKTALGDAKEAAISGSQGGGGFTGGVSKGLDAARGSLFGRRVTPDQIIESAPRGSLTPPPLPRGARIEPIPEPISATESPPPMLDPSDLEAMLGDLRGPGAPAPPPAAVSAPPPTSPSSSPEAMGAAMDFMATSRLPPNRAMGAGRSAVAPARPGAKEAGAKLTEDLNVPRSTQEVVEQVRAMKASGMSIYDIKELLGMNAGKVRQMLAEGPK